MQKPRIQKDIWLQEHRTSSTIPSVGGQKPADNVVALIEFLKENQIDCNKRVVDIGCGKGRNSIYLAQQGCEVFGFDYIELAIEHAQQQAQINNLADKIHFSVGAMDERWNFPDNYFDIAVDSFSSIDIETKQGREICKKELFRTLKPGGYALICVVAAHDEFEKELMSAYPGGELHSSLWPQNGKFQKNYDEHELKEFYSEFTLLSLREITKKAFKLNREFISTHYRMIVQKPENIDFK